MKSPPKDQRAYQKEALYLQSEEEGRETTEMGSPYPPQHTNPTGIGSQEERGIRPEAQLLLGPLSWGDLSPKNSWGTYAACPMHTCRGKKSLVERKKIWLAESINLTIVFLAVKGGLRKESSEREVPHQAICPNMGTLSRNKDGKLRKGQDACP